MLDVITPNWPAPDNIRAYTTTRTGGVSRAPYDSLNLNDYIDDNPKAVKENRRIVCETLQLPREPLWLKQVHGTTIVDAATAPMNIEADASFATQSGIVCVTATADCLPLLLCNKAGTKVAAVHAGWKGIAVGVIEAALKTLEIAADETLAWMGPAIGPQAFEVRRDVYDLFVNQDPQAAQAFKPIAEDQWLADIYLLAKQRLAKFQVKNIYGGEFCTYSDAQRFYSFRRDNVTGRMATMIWIQSRE